MGISRIFFNGDLVSGQNVLLDLDRSHYILDVLRLKTGDSLILFNGRGEEFQAKLIGIKRKLAEVNIENIVENSTESNLKIHLGQGISRGERMDYAIQKAVELGVAEITPIITERCNVKLDVERSQKRLIHWQKIAISACEQSGRSKIPKIHPPQELSQWIRTATGLLLVCDPQAKSALSHYKTTVLEVSVLIGPEGGFTQDELSLSHTAGFSSLSMGPRTLRTETATIVALTLLQFQWGDL